MMVLMASEACPNLATCPFFNEHFKNMPAIAEMTKNSYCRSDQYETCARFVVAKALGKAPDDLYPDQKERIASILDGAKRL